MPGVAATTSGAAPSWSSCARRGARADRGRLRGGRPRPARRHADRGHQDLPGGGHPRPRPARRARHRREQGPGGARQGRPSSARSATHRSRCAGTWSGGCRPTRRAASCRMRLRCTRSTARSWRVRSPTGRRSALRDSRWTCSSSSASTTIPRAAGSPAGELLPLAAEMADRPQLRLRGVMAVPPHGADPAARRSPSSPSCRPGCAPSIRRPTRSRPGMSDDFEAAIRHGSTHVRVGTALLGRREPDFG